MVNLYRVWVSTYTREMDECPTKGEEGRRQLARGTGEPRPLSVSLLGSMKTNLCTKAPTLRPSRAAGSLQTKHLQSHLWVARTFQAGSWPPDRTLMEGSFNKCFQVKKPFLLGWFQASLCQGLNSSCHTAIYCLMPAALKKKRKGLPRA